MEIGIIGLGLIGGSMAKSMKKHFDCSIVAYSYDEEDVKLAYDEKQIYNYAYGDYRKIDKTIFANCDMVFFATPINLIVEEAKELVAFLKDDCVLIDLGSTKNSIGEEMEKAKINYIGGHPMAGSEKTGYANSTDYLFENAYFIVSPLSYTKKEDVQTLINIANEIGAIPIEMDRKIHDRAVSGISHSPHIIASALVNTVKDSDVDNKMHCLAAGGFKDITRIASSNPDIWTSISVDNKKEIISFMNKYIDNIKEILDNLEDDNQDYIYKMFENGRDYRNTFENTGNRFSKKYSFSVDLEDKAGMIATISTILSFNDISIKNIGINNSREYEGGVLDIEFYNDEDMEKAKKLLVSMTFIIY